MVDLILEKYFCDKIELNSDTLTSNNINEFFNNPEEYHIVLLDELNLSAIE